MTYKGQGRLIFAGGSLGNVSGGNLIWIIHNPNETGYRLSGALASSSGRRPRPAVQHKDA